MASKKRLFYVEYHVPSKNGNIEGFIYATTQLAAERIAKRAGFDTREICEDCGDYVYYVYEYNRALPDGALILGGVA